MVGFALRVSTITVDVVSRVIARARSPEAYYGKFGRCVALDRKEISDKTAVERRHIGGLGRVLTSSDHRSITHVGEQKLTYA